MSILLEALKKSEHKRRLGETPTLDTPVDDAPVSGGSRASMIPVLLIVVSAILMTWFGWQQYTVPDQEQGAAEPAVAGEAAPTPAVAGSENEVAAKPKPRTMTEVFQAKSRKRREKQLKAQAGAPDEKRQVKQSFKEFVAEPETESEPVVEVAEAGTEAEQPPPAEDPGLQPHIAEPISYWELPQGVRDNLPDIKISVLVYAEEPSDRFLLSNGQRLVEQEELENGLVLDEIRRDGAVFTYRKYRFLVKG